MNNAAGGRSRMDILADLLELTRAMLQKCQDADFLIASVNRRQELMDEYDELGSKDPESAESFSLSPQAKGIAEEIISMDKTIQAALEKHRVQAKSDVAASNNRQKVLGYVSNAISSSGSYMDYRK